MKTNFYPGDKVSGTITAIDQRSVFVNVNSRSDAVIDLMELQDEDGTIKVAVGEKIEAFCISSRGGEIRLTTKMTGEVADNSMQEAYDSQIPVEGKVIAERKGGYEIKVGQNSAFCPYSQIDLYRRDPSDYIGKQFAFTISEYSENGRNIVLNRRKLMEKEREQQQDKLKDTLHIGDLVAAKISRIMDFGAFADLGFGIEGLIHVSELAWGNDTKPNEIVKIGQDVKVIIKDINWGNNRISLSLRQAQGDPWSKVGVEFVENKSYTGTVTKLTTFGAFVQLIPGVEGLVHISKLGAEKRIMHAKEVVAIGDDVEVQILSIDYDQRRISLSMQEQNDTSSDAIEVNEAKELLETAARVIGTVESIKNYGVFIKLPDDRTGLLHISQVELKGSSNPGKALYKMFPPNSQVEVIIKEIEGNKVSLTLPATLERESQKPDLTILAKERGKNLGSLGDLFGNLKL